VRRAKSCQHTALGKKFAFQFHQLLNCQILPNKCAEFCQICAPFAKRRLPVTDSRSKRRMRMLMKLTLVLMSEF